MAIWEIEKPSVEIFAKRIEETPFSHHDSPKHSTFEYAFPLAAN